MTRARWIAAGAASALALAGIVAALAFGGASGPIEHGRRDRAWVALTFDADMSPAMLARPQYDENVVETLRAERAPATIFLTGLWAQTYSDVVAELARDPLFELESHSLDHAAFATPCFGLAPAEDERSEVVDAAAAITAAAGVAPRYFRFPGGCYRAQDVALVRSLGEEPVQWDVLSGDSYERDPAAVVRNVLAQVRPGSIVVMHLNGKPNAPATARALRELIPELRRRGFRLVTLRELLAKA